MPAGDQWTGSFQDALKELLSSSKPETTGETTTDEAASTETVGLADRPGQVTVEEDSTAPAEVDVSRTQPAYEVEIIPPQPIAPSKLAVKPADTRMRWIKKGPSTSPDVSNHVLEGDVQVLVLPTVSLARIAEFEQSLKEHQGLQWQGTLGKSKQGTTILVQLDHPTEVSGLFQGRTSVERAEVARMGKGWQIKVSLPQEMPAPAPIMEIPPPAPVQPIISPAPAPATPQYEPRSSYLEPAVRAATASQADLEVSPVASLDALNRFEKIVTSLSPGTRVVNVLSLDGVSTVLITLEGISRDTLAGKLSDRIADIQVDIAENRIIARLPEKW